MRSFSALPLAGVMLGGTLALHCATRTDGAATAVVTPDGGRPAGGGDGTGPLLDDGGALYSDFPSAPYVDPALPPGSQTPFGQPSGAGDGGSPSAPCVTEPQDDAMVPRNWTPLFVEWSADASQVVTEIRLTVDNQAQPYIAYVAGRSFSLPQPLWSALARHSAGHDVNVDVRTADIGGSGAVGRASASTRTKLRIAPVDAPGSVVYWSSKPEASFKGFTIGDTASKIVLTPPTAGATSTGSETKCVSCHASSIDGKLIFYTRDAADGSRAVDVRRVATPTAPAPGDVSPAALALLGRDKQYAPQLSPAHYAANDAVVLTVFRIGTTNELVWTDLHAADASGWGPLARVGDTRNVSTPAWRHDGTAVAYTSSAGGGEGVIADVTATDSTVAIYTVPYANRQGGAATPLAGASDSAYRQFYPTYSPNDTLLAFNRTTSAVSSYNQPSAELAVVPGGGGVATRLRANDPAICSGKTSPGLTNSWPRWAPSVGESGDLRYYWLVFSSTRRAATVDRPQLFISAIVTRASQGAEAIVAEYPAVYVVAQDPLANNHIPAWDAFDIATIPR